MLTLVVILSKILIAVAVVGLLRCSASFRMMSRQLDDQVYTAVRRMMSTTEDYGYPPQLVPLLILLIALSFMLSAYVTMPGGR